MSGPSPANLSAAQNAAMNAFRVLVQQILKQDATENERYKATNNAVLAIRNYQNKKAQVPNSSAAASVNVTRGNAAPTTKKSFMAGVVGKLSNLKTRLTAPRVKAEAMNVAGAISLAARVRARFRRVTGVTTGTPPHVEFNKAENYFKTQPNSNRVAANKLQAAANLDKAKAKAENAANRAMKNNATVNTATAASVEAKAALAEANLLFKNTNQKRTAQLALKATRDAASGAAQGLVLAKKRAEAAVKAAAAAQAAVNKAKREAEAAAAKAAAEAKKAANAAAAKAANAAAAKAAAEAKAAANKTAKITKLKKNISNAHNAANRARQAVNASKAEAAAAKARNLRAQLNCLGADQAAKNVANQQVQEARGHADAAKKAAAQKTFDAELAQFIKVKSYAKPESLATILARMNGLAPIAGIATNNARLLNARNTQRKVAIREFIQEIWPMTARGGAPGVANVNRIAKKYKINLNADKNTMKTYIPNIPTKNSIIGWKSILRRPDANYAPPGGGGRRDALRGALGLPLP